MSQLQKRRLVGLGPNGTTDPHAGWCGEGRREADPYPTVLQTFIESGEKATLPIRCKHVCAHCSFIDHLDTRLDFTLYLFHEDGDIFPVAKCRNPILSKNLTPSFVIIDKA